MHDEGPDADPGHESEVIGSLGDDDVIDRVRKDGDGTGDADNDQRLCRKERENHAAQYGSQENFVDAERVVCLGEHVK